MKVLAEASGMDGQDIFTLRVPIRKAFH